MALPALQTPVFGWAMALERWLEAERDQLALWLPVMLGTGIGLWFLLPDSQGWMAVIVGGLGLALAGAALGGAVRSGRSLMWVGLALALGCMLAWGRATLVAAPVLPKPAVVEFSARIEAVELLPAKEKVRLMLAPAAGSGLPPKVRVSLDAAAVPKDVAEGAGLRMKARLVPPPGPAVPDGYDFTRAAWFKQIGAVGTALGPVQFENAPVDAQPGLRARLSAHIRSRLTGSAGGIAAAFAAGDRGGIATEDEEAMRASGLTHLLSVSGLHITAVVAAAMFLTLRLLALSPRLALRWQLPLIAAGVGALAGIGYTILTGAEVPTIRSCIAALLVLIGIALGREAMTLRLVATGALIVLVLWPETLVGPSFQLSFAAITSIVALHDNRFAQALFARRDEGLAVRAMRSLGALMLTGLIVEAALAPIALYHFHKQGLYGALANMIAIPLTTFVIMPLEALALGLDLVGLGAPFWWLTGHALDFLLWIARTVATAPGAVAMSPSVPLGAFVLTIYGGLWLLLWKTRPRLLGLLALVAGVVIALQVRAPDILVTADGTHVAIRDDAGNVAIPRPRAGEFVRDALAERAGMQDPLYDLDGLPGADCGRDICSVVLKRGGRSWHVAATRSAYRLPWREFADLCSRSDIVVSNRRLPRGCAPRWLKADPALLAQSGGLAISLASDPRVTIARNPADRHPWAVPQSAGLQ